MHESVLYSSPFPKELSSPDFTSERYICIYIQGKLLVSFQHVNLARGYLASISYFVDDFLAFLYRYLKYPSHYILTTNSLSNYS